MKRDYIEFQDSSYPLAYLITFKCYGTWVHGDARGSVDRKTFNRYGTAKMPARLSLKESDITQLKAPSLKLDASQRAAVETAIREVCTFRQYELIAINVRTNHAHVIVAANIKPEPIMNSFKSYATRKLRSENLVSLTDKVWSRHGSTKYLWTEKHIESAIDYVLYGQDNDVFELD